MNVNILINKIEKEITAHTLLMLPAAGINQQCFFRKNGLVDTEVTCSLFFNNNTIFISRI